MPEPVVAEEPASQGGHQAAPGPGTEQWRAPAAVGLKALVSAAVGIAIAAVFFPLWVAVPVAVLLAVWGLGTCLRRPAATLEPGMLTVRRGVVTRRVPVSQIEAVVLDQGKVTIGKTGKSVVSFYAWRRSRLDAWLKVPDIASDIAHAISKAATAAQPAPAPAEGERKARGEGKARWRAGKNSPVIALACAGVLEIAAALATRVSWGTTAMTVAGIVVALGFGFTGMFTVVFALWTFLTGSRREPARKGPAQ